LPKGAPYSHLKAAHEADRKGSARKAAALRSVGAFGGEGDEAFANAFSVEEKTAKDAQERWRNLRKHTVFA
jgi:hypothetical protein